MNIKTLKSMIAQPASKHWFEKHGSPKSKAIHKARRLSPEEQKEKTKNWPKGEYKEPNHTDYQRRVGRAYND
jgi:hypothetical protein